MERLQKVMAHSGVASRRKSEDIIEQGRVQVNGETVTTLGYKVSKDDIITVDGETINLENKVYYALNKPSGIVSTAEDQFERKTVVDLIEDTTLRIYPVGRLDYDTTGVLILTNDGTLANKLMHPSYEINKTYEATVQGIPRPVDIKQLESGVFIEGGKTAPAKAKIMHKDKQKNEAVVSLTIHEGRYHQVKLMMESIGHPVKVLHRKAFGAITDKNLKVGEYRQLTASEIEQLKRQ